MRNSNIYVKQNAMMNNSKAKNTLLIQKFIYNAYLFPLYILQKRDKPNIF